MMGHRKIEKIIEKIHALPAIIRIEGKTYAIDQQINDGKRSESFREHLLKMIREDQADKALNIYRFLSNDKCKLSELEMLLSQHRSAFVGLFGAKTRSLFLFDKSLVVGDFASSNGLAGHPAGAAVSSGVASPSSFLGGAAATSSSGSSLGPEASEDSSPVVDDVDLASHSSSGAAFLGLGAGSASSSGSSLGPEVSAQSSSVAAAAPAIFDVDAYLKGAEPLTLAYAFQVFGLEADGGGAAGIKRKYTKMSLKYHPDKAGSDPIASHAFKRATELFEFIDAYKNDSVLLSNMYRFEVAMSKIGKEFKEFHDKFSSDFSDKYAVFSAAVHDAGYERINFLERDLSNFVLMPSAVQAKVRGVCTNAVVVAALKDLVDFLDITKPCYQDMGERYESFVDSLYNPLRARMMIEVVGATSVEADAGEYSSFVDNRLLRDWDAVIDSVDQELADAIEGFGKRCEQITKLNAQVGLRAASPGVALSGLGRAAGSDGYDSSMAPRS